MRVVVPKGVRSRVFAIDLPDVVSLDEGNLFSGSVSGKVCLQVHLKVEDDACVVKDTESKLLGSLHVQESHLLVVVIFKILFDAK